MNFSLEPAVVAFLCLILAGLQAAGSVVVVRMLTVCRFHLDRLAELETLESTLSASETKQEARK